MFIISYIISKHILFFVDQIFLQRLNSVSYIYGKKVVSMLLRSVGGEEIEHLELMAV